MKNQLSTLMPILFCALSVSLNGQALSVTITNINHVMCNGSNTGSATATPDGGSPGYTYAWSNGNNMQTATNLAAGMYTVTVTDIQMASATASVTITQPTAIIFQPPTIVNVSCFGGNDGAITANPIGGMPPYEYDWSNGGTTKTINNLIAGNYTVTVTDDNGCTKMATYNVTQPAQIAINLVSLQDETCDGADDGSITISVSGGVIPIFAQWSNGFIGFNIEDLEPGTYTVTVTDANNCTKTASYIIIPGVTVNVNLLQIQNVTCFGDSNGSIAVNATGAPPPSTFLWSNGLQGPSIPGLSAGTYTVTVTNGPTGCTAVAAFMVNQPPLLVCGIEETNPNLCNGDATADLVAHASGGVPGYTCIWTDGGTDCLNNNLPAGTYTVIVTDAHLCTATVTHVVGQPPPLVCAIEETDPNLCSGNSTADLMAVTNGGTPPHSYLWSNGVTGAANPNLPAGTYTVTVTDSRSCGVTCTGTPIQFSPLMQHVFTTPETAPNANNGTATVNGGGGVPPYTYLWSNNATTQTINNLPPGTYTVTVTDANGCSKIRTGYVNPFGCTLSVELGPDIVLCEYDTAIVTAVVTGASGQVSYLWSDGSTQNHIVVSSGGEYCVTIQDGADCQSSVCAIVTETIIPPLTCPVTNESAPNANDGAINCDSMPGLTYEWNNGATTPSISQLTPGQYCLTVTDVNGCTSTVYYNVQPANSQPVRNVILIIADDLGTDYLGFYEDYEDTAAMPNIRRLLSRGVRFTNAMSNPLCSPTRAGILTGRYSFRTGVGDAIPMSGDGDLDTSEKTIPGLLKNYSPSINTANIGKWHLSTQMTDTDLQIPNLIGYDYYAGSFTGALSPSYFIWDKVTNGVSTTDSTYATTENANDAITWIKDLDSNPFFLWLAFNAPHTPLHLPPADLHSYSTLSSSEDSIAAYPKEYFKAMLEALDHEIGRMFDSLMVFDKWDSTDIIFIGDNGNAREVAQITDVSRAKGTIYQYGVHVPFIISGPSVENPGRVSQALVNTQDLFPTILDLMGDISWQDEIPVTSPVDGVSILPILKDESSDIRSWVFTEVFKESTGPNDGKAMRNMDYKLLNFDDPAHQEFYHLSSDPSEETDLLTGTLNSEEIENYNYLCDEMTTLVGGEDFCDSSVGINDPENIAHSFDVYPNPFHSSVTIVFSKEQVNASIRIIDVLGKEVKSINFSGQQLTIEKGEMMDGIYFLQIKSGKETMATKKIILSK